MRRAMWAVVAIAALVGGAQAKNFRWANDGDTNSMDPYARNETFLLSFAMNMYEPLLRRDRDLKLEPALATDWSNTDPTTWRGEAPSARSSPSSWIRCATVIENVL